MCLEALYGGYTEPTQRDMIKQPKYETGLPYLLVMYAHNNSQVTEGKFKGNPLVYTYYRSLYVVRMF